MLNFQFIRATADDYPVIENMGRFYVYDLSRYCGSLPGWELPANGLYEWYDTKKYFEGPDVYPFLIKLENEIVGFFMLNKLASTPDVDWNMAEFFILAKFQRRGIGQQIVEQIWNQFPGSWEVSVIPENDRALKFWSKVITLRSGGNFFQELKIVNHPKPHPMIIFRFLVSGG